MIDITPIMEAVITLVVAIVSYAVIPYIKTKVEADKLARIAYWVSIAVSAAEQIYAGSGKGAEKKAYVVKFLYDKGMIIDEESIDKLIESAVYELKVKSVG